MADHEWVLTRRLVFGKSRAKGLRIVATDLGSTFGDGRPVEGLPRLSPSRCLLLDSMNSGAMDSTCCARGFRSAQLVDRILAEHLGDVSPKLGVSTRADLAVQAVTGLTVTS